MQCFFSEIIINVGTDIIRPLNKHEHIMTRANTVRPYFYYTLISAVTLVSVKHKALKGGIAKGGLPHSPRSRTTMRIGVLSNWNASRTWFSI